jgi:hypothetical protein
VSVSTPSVGQRKRICSEGSRDNSGNKAGGMNLQESGNQTLGIWRSKTQVFVLASRVGQRRRISSKISRHNSGTKAGGMNTQESCAQSRKYRSMRAWTRHDMKQYHADLFKRVCKSQTHCRTIIYSH